MNENQADVPPTAEPSKGGSAASEDRPFLDDREIEERMHTLESEGFPAEATRRVFHGFVKYGRGRAFETAVRRLVPELPDESVDALVRERVFPEGFPTHHDLCGTDVNLLAAEPSLSGRGLRVMSDQQGWTVIRPGGERLQGRDLCRIILLAICLEEMQGPGPPPSY